MVAPIQQRHRAQMNALAETIDELFNKPGEPKKVGFVLLLAEFGKIENGRVNYISNGNRDDMVCMMKELLARFEGKYSEGGAA